MKLESPVPAVDRRSLDDARPVPVAPVRPSVAAAMRAPGAVVTPAPKAKIEIKDLRFYYKNYLALKGINRNAMLVATAFVGLFVVLDLP